MVRVLEYVVRVFYVKDKESKSIDKVFIYIKIKKVLE